MTLASKSVILLLVRFWIASSNALLALVARVLFWHSPSGHPHRVLVIREGYIGDLLVTIPALAHLRPIGKSEPSIALLTHATSISDGKPSSPAAELLRDWGLITTVIYSQTRLGREARQNVMEFKAERAVFLRFTSVPFSSLLFQLVRLRLIGVKVRPEGCYMQSMAGAIQNLQYDAGLIAHQAVSALEVVDSSASLARRKSMPPLPVLSRARDAVSAVMTLVGDRPIIVLGCSAKYWHKRWPLASYRKVVNSVATRHDVAWAIAGTADDAEIAAEMERSTNAFTINACGKFRLAEMAELVRMSSLYVGNDTGLAHLGASLGVPTVTLFSGIHPPGIWEPWSERNVTLRSAVSCQWCRCEYACPVGDKRCLTAIAPERVIESIEAALLSSLQYSSTLRARTRG